MGNFNKAMAERKASCRSLRGTPAQDSSVQEVPFNHNRQATLAVVFSLSKRAFKAVNSAACNRNSSRSSLRQCRPCHPISDRRTSRS